MFYLAKNKYYFNFEAKQELSTLPAAPVDKLRPLEKSPSSEVI